jgi:hypothetical protein
MGSLEFIPIGERMYYNQKRDNGEKIMFVKNKFRVSYYVTQYNVYAYYMGTYYVSYLVSNMEKINIFDVILSQCSDPYVYKRKREMNVELD